MREQQRDGEPTYWVHQYFECRHGHRPQHELLADKVVERPPDRLAGDRYSSQRYHNHGRCAVQLVTSIHGNNHFAIANSITCICPLDVLCAMILCAMLWPMRSAPSVVRCAVRVLYMCYSVIYYLFAVLCASGPVLYRFFSIWTCAIYVRCV